MNNQKVFFLAYEKKEKKKIVFFLVEIKFTLMKITWINMFLFLGEKICTFLVHVMTL